MDISIHAPSRERRQKEYKKCINTDISIHAPSRERLLKSKELISMLRFQSTLPRGSDHKRNLHAYQNWYFNPRSLAGATSDLQNYYDMIAEFQSTLPRGSDEIPFYIYYDTETFQSTLPRGSDLAFILLDRRHLDFNPRSLAGATPLLDKLILRLKISIHAPSRERPRAERSYQRWIYFNPRSLAGATNISLYSFHLE